jgi:hypothetical protein
MPTPNINQILRKNPRSCRYGAPLGDRNFHDSEGPLLLQRVQMVDGDYAPDGTYWGGGFLTKPLWCAFNPEDERFAPAQGSRIYVRAFTREQAISEVREIYPDATFKKEH